MKYLVVLAVVLGVLWWWRRAAQAAARQEPAQPERTTDPPATAREEQLVPCARCGVLVPRSDARLADDGAYYCCDDHRQLGSR